MASSRGSVQEIPPPDSIPAPQRRGVFLIALLVLVVVSVVIVRLTSPIQPSLEWSRQTLPPGTVNLDTLTASDHGFAFLSGMTADGIMIWSTDDSHRWQSHPVAGAASQLTAIGSSLFAYGVHRGQFINEEDGAWLGGVEILFPDEVQSRHASRRPSVIGDDNRVVGVSVLGEVWWTDDGEHFEDVNTGSEWGPGTERVFDPACNPPSRNSPDVPPFVDTGEILVTLIPSNEYEPFGVWPVCEPRTWTSDDGLTWIATQSVLGSGAYVYGFAWRQGRYTAVGGFGVGESVAWTSDDGLEWEEIRQLSALPDVDLFSVDSGQAGWVVLGESGRTQGLVGWTSLDGLCWEPLPEFVRGADAAVSQGQILVLERGLTSGLWIGAVTGEEGDCQ